MTVRVVLDGRPVEIELERDGQRCRFRARARAGEIIGRETSLVEVEPGVYSVLLDGRSFEVCIDAGSVAAARGRRAPFEIEDPRRLRSRASAPRGEGRQNVTAPMPGRVVRVLVSEGDAVEAGQGLAVVEAMKMQNEMKAPKAGRIVSLPVREGATVGAGEILAAVE